MGKSTQIQSDFQKTHDQQDLTTFDILKVGNFFKPKSRAKAK